MAAVNMDLHELAAAAMLAQRGDGRSTDQQRVRGMANGSSSAATNNHHHYLAGQSSGSSSSNTSADTTRRSSAHNTLPTLSSLGLRSSNPSTNIDVPAPSTSSVKRGNTFEPPSLPTLPSFSSNPELFATLPPLPRPIQSEESLPNNGMSLPAAASALQAFTSNLGSQFQPRSSSAFQTYHSYAPSTSIPGDFSSHSLSNLSYDPDRDVHTDAHVQRHDHGNDENDGSAMLLNLNGHSHHRLNAGNHHFESDSSTTTHSTPEYSTSYRENLFDHQPLLQPNATSASASALHGFDSSKSSDLQVPPRKQKGRRPSSQGMELKNHKCPFPGCAWSFSRREHLKRHEKTHTQERPFTCDVPLCGLKFSRLDNLNSHKRTHEKGKRTAQWHGAKVTGSSISPIDPDFPHLQLQNKLSSGSHSPSHVASSTNGVSNGYLTSVGHGSTPGSPMSPGGLSNASSTGSGSTHGRKRKRPPVPRTSRQVHSYQEDDEDENESFSE